MLHLVGSSILLYHFECLSRPPYSLEIWATQEGSCWEDFLMQWSSAGGVVRGVPERKDTKFLNTYTIFNL